MRRITDTELVRNYCEKHNGDIFDINYASEYIFKDIPHVNLRKIVSRLIDSGLLRTISKGVYIIGKTDLSDEKVVINHYLHNDLGSETGSPTGQYLLYKEGFTDKEPTIKTIKTDRTKGNKNIGNVQIIESHNTFRTILGNYTLATAMELFEAGDPNDLLKIHAYVDKIEICLKKYTDTKFMAEVKDLYCAKTYYPLEQMLNSMRISHRVKENYAIQVSLHSQK
jgi:hypothetical protein